MRNGLSGISSDLKEFFDNGINRLTCIVVVFGVFFLIGQIIEISNIHCLSKTIESESKSIRNAVHFRYFNLTNSLEDINKVKIETHTGHTVR